MEVSNGNQFASYMKAVRRRTLDVIADVPEDRAGWRLESGSMSVIDIIVHLATVERALWGSGITDGKPGGLDEPEHSFDLGQALDFMAGIRSDSETFWKGLTPEQLDRFVATPTGHTLPLKRWLVLAAEHEIHHRGFVHAYRKIWGLASVPIYGLTLEKLRSLLPDQENG